MHLFPRHRNEHCFLLVFRERHLGQSDLPSPRVTSIEAASSLPPSTGMQVTFNQTRRKMDKGQKRSARCPFLCCQPFLTPPSYAGGKGSFGGWSKFWRHQRKDLMHKINERGAFVFTYLITAVIF